MTTSFEGLPKELTDLKQFCVRYEKQPFIRDPTTGGLTPHWKGLEGEWTGPCGYLTFAEACQLLADKLNVRVEKNGKWEKRPVNGIGYMNARAEDPARQIVGGDIDCCRNPDSGNIGQWACTFLHKIQPFYVEVSPSRTGIRFFVYGHLLNDVNSVTGHSDQNDLLASDKESILAVKPNARDKVTKGEAAFNCVELYVDKRHLSLTGDKLNEYCYPPEDRTTAVTEALKSVVVEPEKPKSRASKTDEKNLTGCKGSLPRLDILDVIDTTGFTESGGQLFGSHPTKGSTTGRNLIVNPSKGTYCYMHDGIDAGGDAWVWLACECGAVPWEQAGHGVLKDSQVVRKTLQHAFNRGLVSAEILKHKPAVISAEEILSRIKVDQRALKENVILKAMASLKAEDPVEFDLLIQDIKGAIKGAIKVATIHKMIDTYLLESEHATKDHEIAPDILAEANKILDEGRGFEYAYEVWQKRHHGDENLGKGLFLSIGAQSCISAKGVHIHACGPRGSGKSDGAEKASESIPTTHLLMGSASPKALYYLGERLPAGAVVYLDDIGWNDQAAQMFKTCTTFYNEGATHTVVVDQEIKQFRTAPRIIFWLTTADDQTDEQIRDRLLRIDTTETSKHTKEVIDFIFKQRKSGASSFDHREIEVCRAVIYLLKQVFIDVVVPFSDKIKFEGDPRGATIFADLVSAFAVWRHRMRARDNNGAVIACYEDYKDAEIFFNAIKGHGDTKYTPRELSVLQAIKNLHGKATREMVMEKTGLSKGGLADLLNGRSREGQAKYGLLHKCPALTEEEEGTSIQLDDVNKTRTSIRKKILKLPTGYDILSAYGKAVSLSDEIHIKETCSASSYGYAGSSQIKNKFCKDVVRKFVEYNNIRGNRVNEPKHPLSPPDDGGFSFSHGAKSDEPTNSDPQDSDSLRRTELRPPANLEKTKPQDVDSVPANRIRIAARQEFGICGWVDARKIAHALKLPLDVVVSWMAVHYESFSMADGMTGYKQRSASA